MIKNSRFIGLFFYACAAIVGGGIAIITLPKPHSPEAYKASSAEGKIARPDFTTPFRVKPLKAESATAISSSKDASLCLEACLKISTRLNDKTKIDDESFEVFLGQLSKLTAHLEKDETARKEMLDLAMTTPDGNKRALIIDAFSFLPEEQKEKLGVELLKSDNWRLRRDGINLSNQSETLTSDKAKALMDILTQEPHSHVQTRILGILKNSENLKGDSNTLNKLSDIMASKVTSNVKSEALLTKLALQKDPLKAMPDTIAALTSKDLEFQMSALIALERIYEADRVKNGKISQIDHSFVKGVLEDLFYMEVAAEHKNKMERLIREVDIFYERHFE